MRPKKPSSPQISQSMSTIINLTDVRFRWPKQETDQLAIPHLSINRGEHLFIKGASGSGKTTLLNLLAGIILPKSGSIEILGKNLAQLSARQRDQFRADHLGIIFQQFNLLPYLSILDNVQLPCSFSKRRQSMEPDSLAAARELLLQLGIDETLMIKSVDKLSVGQQQRTAVARALLGSPEVIIADEPTSALDSENQGRFLDLLFSQTEKRNGTIVFVSHDERLAKHFSHMIDLTEINQTALAGGAA